MEIIGCEFLILNEASQQSGKKYTRRLVILKLDHLHILAGLYFWCHRALRAQPCRFWLLNASQHPLSVHVAHCSTVADGIYPFDSLMGSCPEFGVKINQKLNQIPATFSICTPLSRKAAAFIRPRDFTVLPSTHCYGAVSTLDPSYYGPCTIVRKSILPGRSQGIQTIEIRTASRKRPFMG